MNAPPIRKSRKQAQQKRTRNKIMDVAAQLYADNGCNNTTVTSIIAKAEISRNTFYRYFSDADDILNQLVMREVNGMTERFMAQRKLFDDMDTQVAEDILFIYKEIRSNPTLAMVNGPQAHQVLPRMKAAMEKMHDISLQIDSTLSFDEAQEKARIREGVDLSMYAEWNLFMVDALQSSQHNFPFLRNETELRKFIKAFIVPSMLKDISP